MTWGLLRTYLLLPAEATTWGRGRLRSVVMHEPRATSNVATLLPMFLLSLSVPFIGSTHFMASGASAAGGV